MKTVPVCTGIYYFPCKSEYSGIVFHVFKKLPPRPSPCLVPAAVLHHGRPRPLCPPPPTSPHTHTTSALTWCQQYCIKGGPSYPAPPSPQSKLPLACCWQRCIKGCSSYPAPPSPLPPSEPAAPFAWCMQHRIKGGSSSPPPLPPSEPAPFLGASSSASREAPAPLHPPPPPPSEPAPLLGASNSASREVPAPSRPPLKPMTWYTDVAANFNWQCSSDK